MAVIDRVMIGEALVIEDRPDGSGLDLLNVAHIDLVMGPRGSVAEETFCRTLTDQKDLHLFTLEQMLSYQFKNKLTLGGSLKWNRLNKAENLFGATAIMNININRLGTLQFNYEKTYLPGYNRVLIPVDIGRMSFYREF